MSMVPQRDMSMLLASRHMCYTTLPPYPPTFPYVAAHDSTDALERDL